MVLLLFNRNFVFSPGIGIEKVFLLRIKYELPPDKEENDTKKDVDSKA